MANPIKVGIIGLGRAGYGMHTGETAPYRDKFVYTACCDVMEDRVAFFSEKFGCKGYTRVEDLVQDPEVELVDICTFSRDHFEHAKLALAAGKTVFLEKPFVMSVAQGEELARMAEGPDGNRLFIRHNRRFEYGFEMVRDIIDSGLLGEVHEIKLTRNGFQRRNDWQTLKAFGGGQIFNWGPHIIDHALRFCGGAYTELFHDLKHMTWAGDRDDHIKLVFKGVNGRIVDMEISGAAAIPTPEYIVYGSRGGLVSEKGGFRLRYLDPNVTLPEVKVLDCAYPMANEEGPYGAGVNFGNPETLPWVEEFRPLPEGPGDGAERIWLYLYDTLREGKPFPVTTRQALDVLQVIETARKNTPFEA